MSAKWIHEVREHMPDKPVLLGKYDISKKHSWNWDTIKCSTQNEWP